ncbi:MAG: hypothetical protein WAQ28_09345 [Bacteroidia bacterium]|jgi:hypothetical protein
MELSEFKPGNCYKVFFEKQKPIEFKYIGVDVLGRHVCRELNGNEFDFNSLEQYLAIKEIDPL